MLRAAILALAAALTACAPKEDGEIVPHKTVAIEPYLGPTVLGDPNAPVEIVEYASTTCSHCREFHEHEFPKLKASHIDTGKAKLRYIVLPTAPAALSVGGAAIARCAGKDKFFDAIGDLFKNQPDLMDAATPRDLQRKLDDLGKRHGLSPDQVGTCMEDDSIRDAFQKDVETIPATVSGTPAFFVNGAPIEENSAAAIGAAVDAAGTH